MSRRLFANPWSSARCVRLAFATLALGGCERSCARRAAVPQAISVAEMPGRPFEVTIDATHVYAHGKQLDETRSLREDDHWALPGLEMAARESQDLATRVSGLSDEHRRIVLADRPSDAPPPSDHGLALIVCEPTVPYQVVKKVLFTLNKAGMTQVNFAVENGRSERGRLALNQSGPGLADGQVELRVEIHLRGYSIVEDERTTGTTCGDACAAWPRGKLREELVAIRERRSSQRAALVIPEDAVPYEELIAAMDACLSAGLDVLSLSGTPR